MMRRFRYGVRTDNAILRQHATLAECRSYLAELTITGRPGEEMGAYIARWTTRNDVLGVRASPSGRPRPAPLGDGARLATGQVETKGDHMTTTETIERAAPGERILARSAPAPDEGRAIEGQGARVVETLGRLGVSVDVLRTVAGPTVVRYELGLGPRTTVAQLRSRVPDAAAAVGQPVRLVPYLDRRAGEAVEISNPLRRPVYLGDVLAGTDPTPVDVALGVDTAAEPGQP